MRNKKILIIDNDRDFRKVISQALIMRGYEAVLESSGYNGLIKVIKERPDAILLDIRMPGMNGVAVIRELKTDSRSAAIPIIVVTGAGSDDQVSAALESGANGVLLKPFNLEDLYAQIERVLFPRGGAGEGAR